MTIDPVSFGQHVLVLIVLLAVCVVVYLYGRFIAGWSAVILFCMGQYGWALLAFILWRAFEDAHRREMFELRAMRFYNGPWID